MATATCGSFAIASHRPGADGRRMQTILASNEDLRAVHQKDEAEMAWYRGGKNAKRLARAHVPRTRSPTSLPIHGARGTHARAADARSLNRAPAPVVAAQHGRCPRAKPRAGHYRGHEAGSASTLRHRTQGPRAIPARISCAQRNSIEELRTASPAPGGLAASVRGSAIRGRAGGWGGQL